MSRVRHLALVALLLAGCSAADVPDEIVRETAETSIPEKSAAPVVVAPPSASAKPPDELVLEDGEEKIVGTYGAAPPAEGSMRFAGTWIDAEGAGRVILSYGPVPEREAWVGKKVIAVGKPYVPEGRSIAGRHVKARIVRLAEP